MANFLIAYKKTAFAEGGYANDPDDRGGETYKGIARKIHPGWIGWEIVDEFKHKPDFPNSLKTVPGLNELVQLFYKKNYWDVIKGEKIKYQPMANSLYDDAVNTGNRAAIKKLQNVIFGLPIVEIDKQKRIKELAIKYGEMDSKTLSKLNNDIL